MRCRVFLPNASHALVHEKVTPRLEIMTVCEAVIVIPLVNLLIHHLYCEVAVFFWVVLTVPR